MIADGEPGYGDQLPMLLAQSFLTGHVDKEALKHSTLSQLTKQTGDESLLDRVTPDVIAEQGASVEQFRLSGTVTLSDDHAVYTLIRRHHVWLSYIKMHHA